MENGDPVEIVAQELLYSIPNTVLLRETVAQGLTALTEGGWRVVQIADTEFSACQRSDGTWRVHPDSSVHMGGCTPVVVIAEEWTP